MTESTFTIPEKPQEPAPANILYRAAQGTANGLSGLCSVTKSAAYNQTIGRLTSFAQEEVKGVIRVAADDLKLGVTSCDGRLSDLTAILSALDKSLENANKREHILWTIHEVQTSFGALLTGADDIIMERFDHMFRIPEGLHEKASPIPDVDPNTKLAMVGKIRLFLRKLDLYKEILEGKKASTKNELHNLRIELLDRLRDHTKHGRAVLPSFVDEPTEGIELTADDNLPIDIQKQYDSAFSAPPQSAQAPKLLEREDLSGKVRILDFFNEIKESRQGYAVDLIDTLNDTALDSISRKTKELGFKYLGIKSDGCIDTDDVSLPPKEIVLQRVTDKRGSVESERVLRLKKINIMRRPMSVGRILEVFNQSICSGEYQGMYEVYGKSLEFFFTSLLKELKEEHSSNPLDAKKTLEERQRSTMRRDLEDSITLLKTTFTETEPEIETIKSTFSKIGRLMNDHPLLVLHGLGGELDIWNILPKCDEEGPKAPESLNLDDIAYVAPDAPLNPPVDDVAATLILGDATQTKKTEETKSVDLVQKTGKGAKAALRAQPSTVKTKEEEQAVFEKRLEEAKDLGHLFSLYNSVLTLLRGDSSTRIKFNELYNSISKTTSTGEPIDSKKIREQFQIKLSKQLIDSSGDVWIFIRWLIKLILPLISYVLRVGLTHIKKGAESQIKTYINNPKLNDSDQSLQPLERMAAAARAIGEITKNNDLKNEQEGEGSLFKEGLLKGKALDKHDSNATPTKIYDKFTIEAIDAFFPSLFVFSDQITQLDKGISDGISKIQFSFIRTILSTASLAVRIPLFCLNFAILRPIQHVLNWTVKTGLKRFLIYIGVVKNAMDATIGALEKDRTKRTVITPIIDRSVLELLNTLWTSLHTSEDGKIIDTNSIDFTKFKATPERRKKQKKAMSAIFEAIQKIQDLDEGVTDAPPVPLVSDLLSCLKDKAQREGLNASSDIAVAAYNTITTPKMLFHMMGTALDAVNSSMKASGEELELEEDDELRDEIHDKVKQLVSLSIHRASEVLNQSETDCNVKLIEHSQKLKTIFDAPEPVETPDSEDASRPASVETVASIESTTSTSHHNKKEYSNVIQNWTDILTDYQAAPESKENFAHLIGIRAQLFDIWKTIQKDIIDLEQDKDTRATSLSIHKKHLNHVVDPLLEFQKHYLKVFDCCTRKEYMENNPAALSTLVESETACQQIVLLFKTTKTELEITRQKEVIGEISDKRLILIKTQIEKIQTNLRKLSSEDAQKLATDPMLELINSSSEQVYYLNDLHKRLEAHANTAKFVKKILGQDISDAVVSNSLSIKEILATKNGSEISLYFESDIKLELRNAFPEYKQKGSRDFEIVEKIKTNFATLGGLGSDQVSNRQMHFDAIEKILQTAAQEKEIQILEKITLGTKVIQGRLEATTEEVVKMKPAEEALPTSGGAAPAPFTEDIQKAINELAEISTATSKLTNVTPIQYNPLPDLTTAPFLRELLQIANEELKGKAIALYKDFIANPHIATFLALRMAFIPFNRRNQRG